MRRSATIDGAVPGLGGTKGEGSKPLYRVRGLLKQFEVTRGLRRRTRRVVRAVDGVDLTILEGETLGLVGESGCGKTTLALCLLRLLDPSAGELLFGEGDPVDLTKLSPRQLRPIRRRMQIVFQDPVSSLNPRMLVKDIVGEPLRVVQGMRSSQIRGPVRDLLGDVGLGPELIFRYPHELSGGQKQRVAMARALALRPVFVVLDEPTSALDVSVQAQVIELLKEIQERLGLTYLFITHNLGVLRQIADRVAVMYSGKIVEVARADTIFTHPKHPYTEALLSAVPSPDPEQRLRAMDLRGEVPHAQAPPAGCRFHPRCPRVFERCGWEPRDLVDRLRELNFDEWKMAQDVATSFTSDDDVLVLHIEGETKGARMVMEKVVRWMTERGQENDPLFLACRVEATATESGTEVRFRFPTPQEPALKEVELDHEVGCFLFHDEVVGRGD